MVNAHLTKGNVHKHFARTVEVAKFGTDMVTGSNVADYLNEVRGRETREEKEQRVKLTNTLTAYLCERARRVFNKPERATGLSFTVDYSDPEAKERISDALESIHGRKSLKEYVFSASNLLNFTDPNAWLLFMFEDYETPQGITTRVFPLIVPSQQAIDYKEQHGHAEWLLRKCARMDEKHERSDFYFYQAGSVTYLREGDTIDEELEAGAEAYTAVLNRKTYRVITYPSPAQTFQGTRVGFMEDPATMGETYCSVLSPAEGVLLDWVRGKSFKDVQQTLHVFLQKFTYGRRCTYKVDDAQCENGYLNGDPDRVCTECRGSGMDLHTSEQHVIRMLLPDSREEMIALNDLVHYANIPLDIYRDLKEELEKLEEMFFNAIFNGGVFIRAQIMQTATEANQERDDVHDSLHRYTARVGELCELGAFMAVDYLELDRNEVSVYFVTPTDYNLEGTAEMLGQLKAAKEAGAPPAAVKQIEHKLLSSIYRGSPWMLELLQAFEEVKPFAGHPEQVALQIAMSRPAGDPDRVGWENFGSIMTQIRKETNDEFYMYEYTKRKELFDAAVRARIEAMPVAPEIVNPFEFGA